MRYHDAVRRVSVLSARIIIGLRKVRDDLTGHREARRLERRRLRKLQRTRMRREQRRQRRAEARNARRLSTTTERRFELDNVELTNRCPFRCVMCPRTEHMTRAQGNMSFEVFRQAIDQYVEENPERAATGGVDLHHFGESLLHPEFDRFIAYANEVGAATRMSVNPLMLKPRIAERLLAAPPTWIMFSLDGHDDASFERIRGVKAAYDVSVRRLEAFLAQRQALAATTFIELSMIDFDENRESIARQQAYWRAHPGIDRFLIKRFVTWDGSAAEINDYAAQLVDNTIRRGEHAVPTCRRPWRKLSVTWDGNVVPCCYDFDKKIVLGNILDVSLKSMWNGERMQALRNEFLSNHVENPLCRNCASLYRSVSTAKAQP